MKRLDRRQLLARRHRPRLPKRNWITICSKSTSHPSSGMNNLFDNVWLLVFRRRLCDTFACRSENIMLRALVIENPFMTVPRTSTRHQTNEMENYGTIESTEWKMRKQEARFDIDSAAQSPSRTWRCRPWNQNLNLNSFSCHNRGARERARWSARAHN